MSRKTISRRDALGVLGKTGAAFGAGAYFFLTLKTSPLAGDVDDPAGPEGGQKTARLKNASPAAEKVVVGGSGSTLVFKISGPAGRHCGVAYAVKDSQERYDAVPGGRGVIGKDGLCAIEVSLKSLPNEKLYFRVVTGSASDLVKDLRGTEAFEVQVSNGAVGRFGGVRERPLEGAVTCATAAAAGYQSKKR